MRLFSKRDNKAYITGAMLLAVGMSLSAGACLGQTVIVDASTTVNVGAGSDDLATLQNIFQDATAPADGGSPQVNPVQHMVTDLNMKRIRILQGDVYCDLDANNQFGSDISSAGVVVGTAVAGDCYPLLWQLKWALTNRLSPHVAVAAYMPMSFVQYGPADTWSTAVRDRYVSYAKQLVNYIVTTSFNGGAPLVVFEVSNEIDIADADPLNWNQTDSSRYALLPLGPNGRFLWWIDPATYNLNSWPPVQANSYPYSNAGLSYPYSLDMRRLDHGISTLQKIFADAVSAVRNDPAIQAAYPNQTIEIAGPAFSSASFQTYPVPNYPGWSKQAAQPTPEEIFLDLTLNPTTAIDPATNQPRFNAPLDRFSFHFYGDFLNGYNSDPLIAPYTTLNYMTTTFQRKLAALGHPEIKLFLSEWGPAGDDANANVLANPDINYSHKGAAWAAAFLTEAVADKISTGSYLIMHDATGSATGDIRRASLMHKVVTSSRCATYYPKPVANVLRMFAMMTGTRRATTLPTSSANLGAFAASDTSSAGVLIYNYDTLMFTRPAVDTPQTFSVQLDNLPFNGIVTVQRYLVDANHSNLAAYLYPPSGQVDPGLQPELQMIEQFNGQVQNGQLILPSRSLGLGVTFWRVLANGRSASAGPTPFRVYPAFCKSGNR